ncbi:MAG: hypothetical protein EBS53_01625 [Bacteroidetes bacterium]|nr:hypothetical protein [Bacteroidota bacterium]
MGICTLGHLSFAQDAPSGDTTKQDTAAAAAPVVDSMASAEEAVAPPAESSVHRSLAWPLWWSELFI